MQWAEGLPTFGLLLCRFQWISARRKSPLDFPAFPHPVPHDSPALQEPLVLNYIRMAARLHKADREQLVDLVAQRPGNEGKVVSMRAVARGVVQILTGVRSSSRSGIGRVLRATKSDNGWRIEDVGGWRS